MTLTDIAAKANRSQVEMAENRRQIEPDTVREYCSPEGDGNPHLRIHLSRDNTESLQVLVRQMLSIY